MNILILGYGKMGKTIEKIAVNRDHRITGTIDLHNQELLRDIDPHTCDVAIEFSQPDAAYNNILTCLQKGIPVVSGTTGWLNKKQEIERTCIDLKGTFFYASNFSIGVNIFFKLNKFLAGIMNNYINYQPSILEIHHTEKKDSPSGTAIVLAEGIIDKIDRIKAWSNSPPEKSEMLEIESQRIGKVPGTHSIKYHSNIDEIIIRHEAFGREGFALGAVMVAEWIKDKNGILTMDDFLDI